MHPEKRQSIIHQLIEIASEADIGARFPTYSSEEGSFRLSSAGQGKFAELTNHILGEADWGLKFSERYIEAALNKILVKAVKQLDSIEPALDELFQNLARYSDELAVFVPIAGLSMDPDTLEIGSLRLRKVTYQFLEELMARISPYVEALANPDAQNSELLNVERKKFESYKGCVLAEYHVIAEQEGLWSVQ